MSRWLRIRQLLESNGQLDLFVHGVLLRPATPSLKQFEQRLMAERGVTFREWVLDCLGKGMTTRKMAAEFEGVYHATLWRWARRTIPGIVFPNNHTEVSEDELQSIVRVWREDGVSEGQAIAARLGGIPIEKVRLAKRVFRRRHQQQSKQLIQHMATTAWIAPSGGELKRRSRYRSR